MNNAYRHDEEWDDEDLAESESCGFRRKQRIWVRDAVTDDGKRKSRPTYLLPRMKSDALAMRADHHVCQLNSSAIYRLILYSL